MGLKCKESQGLEAECQQESHSVTSPRFYRRICQSPLTVDELSLLPNPLCKSCPQPTVLGVTTPQFKRAVIQRWTLSLIPNSWESSLIVSPWMLSVFWAGQLMHMELSHAWRDVYHLGTCMLNANSTPTLLIVTTRKTHPPSTKCPFMGQYHHSLRTTALDISTQPGSV